MPAGRPTRYQKTYPEQAAKLCALGATDDDLADFFNVTKQTINNWKDRYPEFLDSVKSAKAELDESVERSLFQRAMGYSHPEEKVFNNNGEIITHQTRKHYPPDATSMIFWLKNRQPEKWRDAQDRNINLTPETVAMLNQIKGMTDEELESFVGADS